MLLSMLFLCQADCMVVNYNDKWVESLGSVEATSKRSKLEAFQLIKRDCKRRVAKKSTEQPLLVKSVGYYKRADRWSDHQGSSSSADWLSVPTWPGGRFYYSGSTASTWHNQYYSRDDFRLDVDFARVLDLDVCGPIKENKKAVPVYTGDENPLG